MRCIAKAAVLFIALALLAPNLVLAEDYVTDAAQALQHAPVYVAPGTEGTDNYTASKLQSRLNCEDNVVLVMLPAAAEKELGVDINTIASQLSEKLGDRLIIGLAVGKKVVGYAPSLPTGVAADQMRRAESVSNDPVTVLTTFVQNMHLWQIGQPKPKPTPTQLEPPSPQKENQFWFWVIGVSFIIICGVMILVCILDVIALRKYDIALRNYPDPHK